MTGQREREWTALGRRRDRLTWRITPGKLEEQAKKAGDRKERAWLISTLAWSEGAGIRLGLYPECK